MKKLMIVLLVWGCYFYISELGAKSTLAVSIPDAWENVEVVEDNRDTVTATKYNPVPEQCGPNCLITASGSKIDLDLLSSHELKWIAVSRDLLNKYSIGDTVIITSPNPKLTGEWVVKDLMPKRWKNRIDLLVPVGDEYDFHNPHKVTIQPKS